MPGSGPAAVPGKMKPAKMGTPNSASTGAINPAQTGGPNNTAAMGGSASVPTLLGPTGKLTLSKSAAGIAKSMGLNNADPGLASTTNSTTNNINTTTINTSANNNNQEISLAQQKELLQRFEAEVMGEQEENKGTKSEIRARNYEQMVGVLKNKLMTLESATKKRMYLCEKDLDKTSTECSKPTKISDDFDELNATTRPQREGGNNKVGGGNHRDNLVSSDTVFVDAVHLVVRTKQTTETGKKLEAQLEECFGSVNLRELKGKKSKGGLNRPEKPKKSVRQKNEAKKQARNRLEKLLHANMENYVTRSVNDQDMKFKAPIDPEDGQVHYDAKAYFPVSVKYHVDETKDQERLEKEGLSNPEGDMNLRVLLLYAIERISLQSGEALFRRMAKSVIMQEYLLALFWLVKLKFFQPDSTEDDEGYLLQLMAKNYVKIVEFMAVVAHAEYEKDYVFKYLPFIFCNAIYYAFHSLFPGSRHIYTRAFRKTILIQVVQIMHGVQLSQLSVKVSWAKFFPDDIQENEEDGDEGGESFPVQLAFSKRPRSATQYEKLHLSHSVHDPHRQHLHLMTHHAMPHLPMNATTVPTTSSPGGRGVHGGMLASGDPTMTAAGFEGMVPHPGMLAGAYSAPSSAAGASGAATPRTAGLGATTTAAGALEGDVYGTRAVPPMSAGQSLPPLLQPVQRTASSASLRTATGGSGTGPPPMTAGLAGLPVPGANAAAIEDAILGISYPAKGETPTTGYSLSRGGLGGRGSITTASKPPLSSSSTQPLLQTAGGMGATTTTGTKKATSFSNLLSDEINEALIGKLPTIAPTERTMLKHPLEKPVGLQHLTIRQNKETVDAKEISPLMQQCIYQGSERGFRCAQPMARIAPVSWCVAGGSDTHRKRHIPRALIEDICTRAEQSKKEYLDDIPRFRRARLRELKKINAACEAVLSSNQQAISRFSLDLLKQKRLHSKALEKDGAVAATLEDFGGSEGTAFLDKYANYEDEDINAFLESIGESL